MEDAIIFVVIISSIAGVSLISATVVMWMRQKFRLERLPDPGRVQELSARMERMEQAIESVAVEMERVSESQRYLTKLLGERRERAALPDPNAVR